MHGRPVAMRLLLASAIPYRPQLGATYHAMRHISTYQRKMARARVPTAAIDYPDASEAGDFASLGVNPLLLPALKKRGIVEPTEVQRAAFDALLQMDDAVLLSETGTGKTLAYAVPLVHRLLEQIEDGESTDEEDARGRVRNHRVARNQALVLVPNKDLCAQVTSVFQYLLKDLPDETQSSLRVSSLVSTTTANAEAEILVSTPAVALNAWYGPETIRWVILDEADALLGGSFKHSARSGYPIEVIIADVKRSAKLEAIAEATARGDGDGRKMKLPPSGGPRGAHGAGGRAVRTKAWYSTKQFVCVGATMPNHGTKNIREHVRHLFPNAVWYQAEALHKSKAEMSHYFIKIDAATRSSALCQALRHGPGGKSLVFANSLDMAGLAYEAACRELGEKNVALFHKGLPVEERAQSLKAYESGQLQALVCTGLASRGIDFKEVAHVVQFEVATNGKLRRAHTHTPQRFPRFALLALRSSLCALLVLLVSRLTCESPLPSYTAVEFMHRVGRTARAGQTGVTTSLYTDDRVELVEALRDALEGNHPIDHLFSRKRSFKIGIKRAKKAAGTWEPSNQAGSWMDREAQDFN